MTTVKTSDGSASQEVVNELIARRGNRWGDAYVMGHGDTFAAMLEEAALAADQGMILVDLSDTVNFPHTETGKIRLYRLDINIERKTTGQFIIYIGVIIEVDATNGSTKWLLVLHEETDDNATDDTAARHFSYHWPKGLDLEVSAGAMVNLISNVGDTDDVVWQTDVNLDSPAGAAASPSGTGDLVMFVDETADGGTLSICVTAEYITEAV